MHELSLFTGAAGGLLGTHLLGWKPVGYVEYDDYCQRIIKQRIIDGLLPNAPIFSDVRSFISEGYAESYTGMVDVITAGFPCQPFSISGKKRGEADERNMWPATIECLRIIRPRYALLENVPALVVSGYFGKILGDLAESGFDCRWRILSAAEVGAPHRRDRVWIVAYANGVGRQKIGIHNGAAHQSNRKSNGYCQVVLHPSRGIPYTEIRRNYDGISNGMDRLRAIGNGQVPAVAASAWNILTQDIFQRKDNDND